MCTVREEWCSFISNIGSEKNGMMRGANNIIFTIQWTITFLYEKEKWGCEQFRSGAKASIFDVGIDRECNQVN